jgi:FkbM family methyltransferase
LKLRKQIKHNVYGLLNRPGLRPVLAGLATTIATVRIGKLCKVSYDGDWIQRFPPCTLVEPRLTLRTPKDIEKYISTYFLYKYFPSPGDTIVDVGAGAGWETLFFSRHVGKSGRVISIEAHPVTFRCLSKMCQKNGLENVTPIQAAVGDQEGEVQISDTEHTANTIITVGSGIGVRGTTLDITLRTLGITRVDFLSMNIEGAERRALWGMREMVQKTRNVCIGCHDFLADEGGPEEMRTKADVIRFLKENGFAVFVGESEFLDNYVYGLNERLGANS